MPSIRRPEVLRAVFTEAGKMLAANDFPSQIIFPNATVWRGVDQNYVQLPPNWLQLRGNLVPRDGGLDTNRFTGLSMFGDIPAAAGLYCSLQSDALTAELVHYAHQRDGVGDTSGTADVDSTLGRNYVLKLRCVRSVMALDLSVHSTAARSFIERLQQQSAVRLALQRTGSPPRPLWMQLFESEDASVARGVGLAAAHRGLDAIVSATARPSVLGSDIRAGDNLVILGAASVEVPFLSIQELWAFPPGGLIKRYAL